MKEKVLNQSIFLYTCPSCGETFRLNYPTLYHQMENLIMIYLVSESEVEKTYEMFYGENALFDFRTEKYLARIVMSPNQLVEKIQIFDAGKDDRIMELQLTLTICMNLLLHTAMISRIFAMMRTLLSIGSGSLTNLPKQKTNSIFGGYTPSPCRMNNAGTGYQNPAPALFIVIILH